MKEIEKLKDKYGTGAKAKANGGKIEFVLLDSGVYWDFPFTWGNSMIMMTRKIFEKSSSLIKKILAHEWVHLEQRRYPEKYEKFYQTLGFKKQYINWSSYGIWLLPNPDADKYEWIWKSPNGSIYAPAALLESSCRFRTVLFELKEGKIVRIHPVEDIPAYYWRFGTTQQLYHPNEISAHLVADLLVDGIMYDRIDYGHLRSIL
jgi:hypothetical protein